MAQRAVPFRRSDLIRAVESARAADLTVQRIDILRDGGFSLLTVKPSPLESEFSLTEEALNVIKDGRLRRYPRPRPRVGKQP